MHTNLEQNLYIQLLKLSIEKQASDLHLSSSHYPMMRLQGEMVVMSEHNKLNAEHIKHFIHSILTEEQKIFFLEKYELDFNLTISGIGNFRVNIFQQLHGFSAVFRVLPKDIPSVESLRLPPALINAMNLSSGLILITGATGCGKTTTLASLIEYMNTHQTKHIITLEDPIEFIFESKKSLIHQRQIGRDALSFSSALRAALREDPDVIVAGEIRDLDSIRLALTAAETGHLVMATLHASSAPRAISRLIDVFSEQEKTVIRNLISESIQAVVYQSLIKNSQGGRHAAFEIMLATAAIRHLIREDKISQMISVMQTSANAGMCTLEQSMQALKFKLNTHV
jgi:twitching motility protein PilT